MTIFDAAGRAVHELRGDLAAGVHGLVWDGRVNDGRRASPGLYFYRVEAGAYRTTGKMTLLR